ncbi:MAG: hypothetical protein A3E80_05615 [Chlamydiae bacterium RIFCSPHIGHO2_12_FULL_49_9]|nr:MAG: hypothetical protein A3E80_05615 [Chlamydiae bacterium RIFCSPHIGHO2_12_FULL_49_9]
MKKWLFALLLSARLFGQELDLSSWVGPELVLSAKQIILPKFPGAFNPSILETDAGYILTFRYCPDNYWNPWVNFIGAALLDDSYNLISEPELLSTGLNTCCVKSQAEDARIFSYQNRIYLIYNDNVEVSRPWYRDRRDLFIAELIYKDGHFSLLHPIKLFYEHRYYSQYWQKNWTPFVWNDRLFLSYSINPHEILFPNLNDGSCYHCYETAAPIPWTLGVIRGSSPAILVDGEYLSFFHSGHQLKSSVSRGGILWHYFMGAYTFSPNPPFQITKFSQEPIVGRGFYAPSHHEKKVIFPGGFVVSGSKIIVAYGRDDEEIWIAELDKGKLMNSLIPVKSQ